MRILLENILLGLIVALLVLTPPYIQNEEELVLSLSRDFGYSSGTGKIQGTFSMKVSGPDDLMRVVFLIDDAQIGEDLEAPFRLQFNTGDFSLGAHTLEVIGFTSDGVELHSLEQKREFVSAEEGWKTAGKIAIPVIIISIATVLFSAILPAISGRRKKDYTPLGSERNYGLLGGTICPKCNRSFSLHIYGINLMIGRLDRCPHCGRWSLVHRLPLHDLRMAEVHELEDEDHQADPSILSEEEKLRKVLDNTRYQDS